VLAVGLVSSAASCVLGIVAHFLALPSCALLLGHDPLLSEFSVLPALLLHGEAFRLPFEASLLLGLLTVEVLGESRSSDTGKENEIKLFRPCGVGIVDEPAAAETGLERRAGEEIHLIRVLRVGLQHCSSATREAIIQGTEEALDARDGIVGLAIGIAEPLQGGDGDGTIEGSRSERHAVTHVPVEQVALHTSLKRNV